MTTEDFSAIISTLIINGFHIHQVDRFAPDNPIINAFTYDKLGAEIWYSILFSEDKSETPILETLKKVAKGFNSNPLLISDFITPSGVKTFTKEQFFDFFGGTVNTGLILVPNLSNILNELGHNRLPDSFTGEPQILHELYINECLQFILGSPTRRYGSERLFTKLPDGVVLCRGKFMMLYDSKAYRDGFDISSDDINRFAFYVNDFNTRYSFSFGPIFSFVLVSGHFNETEKTISNRSSELYKQCNGKISCITSKELGDIVQIVKENPSISASINWKNVFSYHLIEAKNVQQEISRIKSDKLL